MNGLAFLCLKELQELRMNELAFVLPDSGAEHIVSNFSNRESLMCLLSHTPMVIEFLLNESEKYIDGVVQLHERNRKLLRCLLSWVQAGCLSEISAPSLPAHPLLSFVFNSLQQSRSFGHHYIQGATYSSRVSGRVKIFCLLKAK
nr:PREDICTED: uncharacterized protein LOC108200809 isoform X1 [Daucus carota subsp. sativus]XP_017224552.1 PREDICTED: uncharacterized protein LOC108200809 isoform X1 [Daucus carota subsp. sativus]XP_017228779.1 PREDICTED: uncharacterized protein LOC108192670 isoform X1 [Daucus carota subsp. sativus]